MTGIVILEYQTSAIEVSNLSLGWQLEQPLWNQVVENIPESNNRVLVGQAKTTPSLEFKTSNLNNNNNVGIIQYT